MPSLVARASIGSVGVALLAACSSVAPSTGTTTIPATATIPATTAGATTTPAVSTTAPAAAVPVAAIVPEVVCNDVSRGLGALSGVTTTVGTVTTAAPGGAVGTSAPAGTAGPALPAETLVYFAYRNAAGAPVAVPLGEGNRLDGGAADDDPLLPTVFASGRVSPAFVAIVAADGAVPTWTLRGTDGVVRTAAPTAATPGCGDQLAATTPDTRAPRVAVTFGPAVVGTPAEPKVAVIVRLDGLPAASVCPPGLTALPPLVKYLVLDRPVTTDADGAARVELPVGPLPFRPTAVNGVRVRVDAFVADRCEGAGAVTRSWATSPSIDILAGTLAATCAVVEGTAARPATFDECPVLGATGGIKIRRVP